MAYPFDNFSYCRATLAYTNFETETGLVPGDGTPVLVYWNNFVWNDVTGSDFAGGITQGTGLNPPYLLCPGSSDGAFGFRLTIEWADGFAGARHIGFKFPDNVYTPPVYVTVAGSNGNADNEISPMIDSFSGILNNLGPRPEVVVRQFSGSNQYISTSWSSLEIFKISGNFFYSGTIHDTP